MVHQNNTDTEIMETTPDRIAHGRAMLNTIEAHFKQWGFTDQIHDVNSLREAYDGIEWRYNTGQITDPHPRQVGDRILPRWEWFLHRIAVRLGLGGAEE